MKLSEALNAFMVTHEGDTFDWSDEGGQVRIYKHNSMLVVEDQDITWSDANEFVVSYHGYPEAFRAWQPARA